MRSAVGTGFAMLIASCAAMIQSHDANAQDVYPSRPIRMIVAYPPGGAVDIMARAVAQKLQDSLGQPVVVDNRPGGNGTIGTIAVAKAPADGYTMLVIDRGSLTINPNLFKVPPFDAMKDFAYTGVSADLHYVLAVTSGLPAKTFQEFVQLAKAKPGSLNYASFGTGSIIHLNFEQMNSYLGINVVHVPYKGSADASIAVVSGDVSMMMSSYAGVAGFLRDGKLRPLAVSGPKRLAQLPDVPTVSEAGGGTDTMVPTYFTYAVPAGTSRAIIAKLNTELTKAQLAPDVADRLAKAGLEANSTTPEAFTEGVRKDLDRFGKLIKTIGIPLQ